MKNRKVKVGVIISLGIVEEGSAGIILNKKEEASFVVRYQYANACEPACRQAGDTNKIQIIRMPIRIISAIRILVS